MPKLTKQTVDAADAKDKPAILWDDDLKGFFLRVMPSGTKTYGVVAYPNGRQTWLTLGRHGPLTPQQARDLAIQNLAAVARGEDPRRKKQETRGRVIRQGEGEISRRLQDQNPS